MLGALLIAILAAESPARPAVSPPAPAFDEQVRFFETRIRPVLVDRCHGCHGPEKQWSGLRLDSREAMLQGGERGPALNPGDPEASRIIETIRHTNPDLKMPEDEPLSAAQIADFELWVSWGAPFPSATPVSPTVRDPNHWAFRPLAQAPPPEVQRKDWPVSPLDAFVLAEMERAGLAPAEPAEKPSLIRRATFDLTGLPPTSEEIEAFLSDDSEDAYPRLVDRLLASPAYGERWGRHWLDVARYADSNGLDENVAHGAAWRYRDYVVSTFARDLPFDRFVIEQLAGDLLPAATQGERHERLIATGFLGIGPKVLAEVNEAKMRLDIIDEQIDTLGKAFMGLTLGCARCHDHKFDPIDATDYYALAGILQSTRGMDTYTKVAKWHENLLPSAEATAMQAEYDSRLAEKKQAIERLKGDAERQVREGKIGTGAENSPGSRPANAPTPEDQFPESVRAELAKLREELVTLEKSPPELPAAMGVCEDAIADAAIRVRGNPLNLGQTVPRGVPQVLKGSDEPRFSPVESGRRELAEWLVGRHHPLTARVLVNRVWRWRFGAGLVRSTDNFGTLGERPSHPELLDWLALGLIDHGWSLKWLHREMLLSSVYRQSHRAEGNTAAINTAAIDPENRWLARFSPRRLEAEEIRDALLATSGQLDRTMGGSLLKVKNRAYLFDHTSIDTTEYTSLRRSLYLPVIRNHVYDFFQLLDFPNPSTPEGNRVTTTVAPQALLMLNSDLVMKAADALADRLLATPGDDARRISRLYVLAFGREPTPAETQANLSFLEEMANDPANETLDVAQRRRAAWGVLCHVTYASNEFIYVE